ncbi:hypothetical protein [Streptomyces tendae]|uniref:hypothetical protein n=1 Tax=Streptomyces tendae TaxID=1932 RepID=UPI003D734A62
MDNVRMMRVAHFSSPDKPFAQSPAVTRGEPWAPPDSPYTSQSFIVIDSLIASSGPSRFSNCVSNTQGPVRTKVALCAAAVFALLWDGRSKSFQAVAPMPSDGTEQKCSSS